MVEHIISVPLMVVKYVASGKTVQPPGASYQTSRNHPIETAEYAVAQGLDSEPAFNWWVPHVIKKRAHIISLVKKRSAHYLYKTHKFGVQVPKSAKHALELDKQNGNTFWKDSIAKEMKNVCVAFQILDENEGVPIGYKFICCHVIFDVKMEDFRRKSRLVAGGHMTDKHLQPLRMLVLYHVKV